MSVQDSVISGGWSSDFDFTRIRIILDEIRATASAKGKQKIIARYANDRFFRMVVLFALDPYHVFKMSGSICNDLSRNGHAIRLGLESRIFEALEELSSASSLSSSDKRDFADLVKECGPDAVDVVNRILNKDLRCGAGVKTFHNADKWYRENIPVHQPMKGISDLDVFFRVAGSRGNVNWSVKLDGTRCHAVVYLDRQFVVYLSSNGKEIPNFHVFDDELLKSADKLTESISSDAVVFDGEVINVQGDFSRQMSQFRRLHEMDPSGFRFRIFDVFPQQSVLNVKPFSARYAMLVNDSGLPVWLERKDQASLCAIVPHFALAEDDPQVILRHVLDEGFEGIMLKTWDGVYQPKRVNYWCKLKAVFTDDLPVVGKVEGTGKYAGMLGALIVDNGKVEVEVGSGFTDAERREFWENPPECIEIKYQEELPSGSLRFPVFVRARDDKGE